MPLRRKRGVERKKKEVGKVVAFCLLIPPSLVVSSIFVLMSCITESQFPKNSALLYSFVTLNPKKGLFLVSVQSVFVFVWLGGVGWRVYVHSVLTLSLRARPYLVLRHGLHTHTHLPHRDM